MFRVQLLLYAALAFGVVASWFGAYTKGYKKGAAEAAAISEQQCKQQIMAVETSNRKLVAQIEAEYKHRLRVQRELYFKAAEQAASNAQTLERELQRTKRVANHANDKIGTFKCELPDSLMRAVTQVNTLLEPNQ